MGSQLIMALLTRRRRSWGQEMASIPGITPSIPLQDLLRMLMLFLLTIKNHFLLVLVAEYEVIRRNSGNITLSCFCPHESNSCKDGIIFGKTDNELQKCAIICSF